MNVRLLRRIQKHILEEPRRFAMGTVDVYGTPGSTASCSLTPSSYNNYNKFERDQAFPECGTMACIWGWAKTFEPEVSSDGFEKLCNASEWPQRYADRYRYAKTPRGRARIAVQRIENYIKTKGRE